MDCRTGTEAEECYLMMVYSLLVSGFLLSVFYSFGQDII